MKVLFLALALAIPCAGLAQAPIWSPGSTTSFQWPAFSAPLSVRVPDNYTTDRKWPIVFHYHTISMEPNVVVPGMYSGNRDFIMVTMTYREAEPQFFQKAEPYWEAEFQILREIRAHLVSQQLLADVGRTYVGGDGVGGWYASYFGDLFGNELAGIYMTGAGTFGESVIKPMAFRQQGKPVYVGAGQLEMNLGYALNAKERFRRLGGRVTFDEYVGQPHIVPVDQVFTSERLRQWFQIEGNRTTPNVGREMVAEWQKLVALKLEGFRDPLDQYLFLDHLTSFPFYAALPAEFRGKLQSAHQQLLNNPGLKKETDAQKVFEQLQISETRDFSIDNRRNIAHHYANLFKRYPETHFGKRAGVAVMRLRNLVEDPDRFLWNSFEQRAKFIKDVAERPLPEMPEDKLTAEMERVTNLVYIN